MLLLACGNAAAQSAKGGDKNIDCILLSGDFLSLMLNNNLMGKDFEVACSSTSDAESSIRSTDKQTGGEIRLSTLKRYPEIYGSWSGHCQRNFEDDMNTTLGRFPTDWL